MAISPSRIKWLERFALMNLLVTTISPDFTHLGFYLSHLVHYNGFGALTEGSIDYFVFQQLQKIECARFLTMRENNKRSRTRAEAQSSFGRENQYLHILIVQKSVERIHPCIAFVLFIEISSQMLLLLLP